MSFFVRISLTKGYFFVGTRGHGGEKSTVMKQLQGMGNCIVEETDRPWVRHKKQN
jgi:predicted ATPase